LRLCCIANSLRVLFLVSKLFGLDCIDQLAGFSNGLGVPLGPTLQGSMPARFVREKIVPPNDPIEQTYVLIKSGV
jgi:hypothetical protein